MRSLIVVLTAVLVMSLAFWAYRENYETQAAQAEAAKVQREISQMRQRLRVLNAEWAYLNRPQRLRDLADLNFDKLGLLPLRPEQFGKIDQVSFPKPDPDRWEVPILSPIEVSHREDGL